MIVLGGMIGVGKTTVAKILADAFSSTAFYEDLSNHSILPLFYTASKEESEKYRYPFLLQLSFLNSRFQTIKQASVNQLNILDRSIYEDWYFAKVNHDLGRISDLEFQIYEDLLQNMLEGVIKKPILMVYLYASFDVILKHINERGRSYEKDESLIDYYQTLWKGYDDWLDNHYHESSVIKIDMNHWDVVKNKSDQDKLIHLIKNKLASIK